MSGCGGARCLRRRDRQAVGTVVERLVRVLGAGLVALDPVPLDPVPRSGVFGSQRILNGEAKQPHYGVDVAVPTGTRVYAPASGVVSLAHPDMYYTGGTLMVDHGHGLSSAFLHLSKLRVKEGQAVRQGDLIAEAGATGRATGAHLDWRVNWFDARVDAQMLVPPMESVRAHGARK